MHEYTMAEEELKRCQTAKEYYGLCKVYKKSGPGPKNGEQYGAPFREEDWANDELEVQCLVQEENRVKRASEITDVAVEVNHEHLSSLNHPEGIMSHIADDLTPVQQLGSDYGYALDQFASEEETQRTFIDHPSRDVSLPVPKPLNQKLNEPAGLDFTQSQLQLYKPPEVSSSANIDGKDPWIPEEDLIEDFLEMDDLIGAESSTQNPHEPVNNLEKLQFDDFDGFSEFDLYRDASMFLAEAGHVESEQINGLYMNTFDDVGFISPISSLYLNNVGNTSENHQPLQQSNNANGVSYQQGTDDRSIVNSTEAYQGWIPSSTSGTEI